MKQTISIKIREESLSRNQYCYPKEGRSQIYTCGVTAEIGGDYETFRFDIMSGFNYEIEIANNPRLAEGTTKKIEAIFRVLNKHLKSADHNYSYKSFERRYQIDCFWELLRNIDPSVEYKKCSAAIELYRKLEDETRDAAIAIHIAESANKDVEQLQSIKSTDC